MVLALRARMAELRTIFEIGQKISAGVDFEETLMYILSAIHDVIPYDMAELGFYDEKENHMVVRAAANYVSAIGEDAITYYEPETAHFYDVNEGILARLVEKRSALLIANMQEDQDLEIGAERKWGGTEAKSYLGVVLKAKNKVIGSIELVSGQPDKFDDDNSRLLTSIAVQAAIEVQNAQEVHEREQRLAQQIQQMDIVIDKDKQSEQVDDIINSNFFKSVQEKARKARKGNQE
jgi:transcriptional regulator with GAF, ATPase, and Fis domain